MTTGLRAIRWRRLASIGRDIRGLAMIEMAFATPLLLTLGIYGVETANLALVNLKVSQIALAAADNSSRVGASSNLASKQLRESDLSDILQAARLQGNSINFSQNGRLTLSSLENVQQSYDTGYVQRVHWQRCLGVKSGTGYDSSYGTTNPSAGAPPTGTSSSNLVNYAGITATAGIGSPAVMAPQDAGVMFVEVNYDYQPLVSGWLFGVRRINYNASFVVRDKRDLTKIYNSTPATAETCDKHNP